MVISINADVARLRMFLRGSMEPPSVRSSIYRLMNRTAPEKAEQNPQAFILPFFKTWQNEAKGLPGMDAEFAPFREHWDATDAFYEDSDFSVKSASVRYLFWLPTARRVLPGDEALRPLQVNVRGSSAKVRMIPMAFTIDFTEEFDMRVIYTYIRQSSTGAGILYFDSSDPKRTDVGSDSEAFAWFLSRSWTFSMIMYVNESAISEYDAFMANMTLSKLKKIRDPVEKPSSLSGVISVLANSPDASTLMPLDASAWEDLALKGQEPDTPSSAPKSRLWARVALFTGIPVGIVLVVLLVYVFTKLLARRYNNGIGSIAEYEAPGAAMEISN